MAITDIPSALAQYSANLSWQQSISSAEAALEAVRFLLVNRAQRLEESSMNISYESLECEKKSLEKFLGASSPRAFGRSRRVRAIPHMGGIA